MQKLGGLEQSIEHHVCPHVFLFLRLVVPVAPGHKPSQRSLHYAPIFRLLLKVAVKGTHQCDFTNFWGSFGLPTQDRVSAGGLLGKLRCSFVRGPGMAPEKNSKRCC